MCITIKAEMGSILTRSWNAIFGEETLNILMTGLDAGGKTTILYKLQPENIATFSHTSSWNMIETITNGNIRFICWDFYENPKYRILMRHYFQDAKGLIYVVDSNNLERISEAKEYLYDLLKEKQLEEMPLLLFANKQDLKGAMNKMDVAKELELENITKRKWHVQECCAITGKGVDEGLNWLVNSIEEDQLYVGSTYCVSVQVFQELKKGFIDAFIINTYG
eukprot:TRINITY_DN3261_c0_g1_i6.p1 TRINITY_DN3261_c0_g1~~TRINITY_DN3261_c0_g1_i6.p1  ORF type:complete len:222 (+),score=18.13 TRINITY_DN3261_c0_g1_i6:73-738(+)